MPHEDFADMLQQKSTLFLHSLHLFVRGGNVYQCGSRYRASTSSVNVPTPKSVC